MICESASVAPCSCSDAARQRLTPTSAAFATLVFTLQRAVARDGANAELPAGWTLHHKHLATTTAAETDAAASDSSTSSSNSSSSSSDGTAADELRAVTAAYFSSFYSKSCCFQDLRPYLGVLLDLQRQQQSDVAADVAAAHVAAVMITWLREQADSAVFATDVTRPPTEAIDEDAKTLGIQQLRRLICAHQCLRFMQGAQYSSSSTSNESSSSSSSEQQHKGSNGDTTDATTDAATTSTAARCADLRKYAQHLVLQYRATLHLNAGAEGGQRYTYSHTVLKQLAVKHIAFANTRFSAAKLTEAISSSATAVLDSMRHITAAQSLTAQLGSIELSGASRVSI
eukprot:6210-Heterococcus_DN1.PRE.2